VTRLQPGRTVLVLGSGISGILHINLARALGAGRIVATDVNEYRLSAARRFGADQVIYAKQDVPAILREVNDGRGADLVIICTGALSAYQQALTSVEPGGSVLFFAPTDPGIELGVPVNDFWRNSITLLPSYGAAPADLVTALDLIRFRRVSVADMVTHRMRLEEISEGFRLAVEARESLKVIVEPHRK
jgi:L-iditol 2-dehydrogenase